MCRVEKWEADGHITIIGHGSQQEALSCSRDNIRAKLSYAASDRIVVLSFRELTIIIGVTDGVPKVHRDQMAEEKVHWGVELRASLD